MLWDKNKLVFFYPSIYDNHQFSNADELPFDELKPEYIIDVSYDDIVIFPHIKSTL